MTLALAKTPAAWRRSLSICAVLAGSLSTSSAAQEAVTVSGHVSSGTMPLDGASVRITSLEHRRPQLREPRLLMLGGQAGDRELLLRRRRPVRHRDPVAGRAEARTKTSGTYGMNLAGPRFSDCASAFIV